MQKEESNADAPEVKTSEAALRAQRRPYRCPGCDREAHVLVQRTTLHKFGSNGLVYSISCRRSDDEPMTRGGDFVHGCLGAWFSLRGFTSETNAISEWNDAIIEMAAAALGITARAAIALKEGRAQVTLNQPRGLSAGEAPVERAVNPNPTPVTSLKTREEG